MLLTKKRPALNPLARPLRVCELVGVSKLPGAVRFHWISSVRQEPRCLRSQTRKVYLQKKAIPQSYAALR
jgi:hypothetical protein